MPAAKVDLRRPVATATSRAGIVGTVMTISVGRPGAAQPPQPGKGGRRGRVTPRGRQVETTATVEVRELLGERPRRRDLLIEFLHLIQDRYGCLSAQHLAALADEVRLPQAAVYEVATFYAHFDVVKEGEAPPPPVTIRVCDSLTCAMMGGLELLAGLQDAVDPAQVRVVRAPCMGRCDTAPVCEIGHRHVDKAGVAQALAMIGLDDLHPAAPDHVGLERYLADGGYRLWRDLRDASDGALDDKVRDLLSALDASGLRGLGGAGFPTGRKWGLVRQQPAPRYMCVNADEGEPGTFKDRHYLEREPRRFLEGALVAARVVEAERVFVYLRDEYPAAREILRRELAAL